MIPGCGISLLLHCRSLNGALANITVPGLSDDEKQQEGRGRMDLTVSTHNKSGSVLVGNVQNFYNCKLRTICFCHLLSVLSIVVQPVQLGL